MTDKRKGAKRQLAAGNWPLTTELRSLAGEFFEWMAFTHYSPNTIKNRKVYLDYFFSWCEERGLESPQEITKPIIERYQRYLFNYKKKRDEQPLSIRSQHSRLVPVRAFFKFEIRPQLVVPPDDNVLFLTDHGDVFTPGRLTQMVREYVDTADIGKKGSCHLFRHTMATLMLEHGADIRFIQQMLGHAKLETTQIYTQISIRQLKDIHTATHPARLDSKRSEAVRKELEDELAEDQDEDEELPPKKPEN